MIHFSLHRWLDQGEDDGKIVRELYARNNSILSASECQMFLGKLCLIMTEERKLDSAEINGPFPPLHPQGKSWK